MIDVRVGKCAQAKWANWWIWEWSSRRCVVLCGSLWNSSFV